MNLIQLKITLFLASSLVKEIVSQTCRLYNSENNLLTLIADETFRLPLNNYFIGEGLMYNLSENSGFTQVQQPWGPGVSGNIISTTSMQFNSNLNIQSYKYFALSIQNQSYQILESNISDHKISYSKVLNTIDDNITCYVISIIQESIVVTCTEDQEIVFYNYNLDGVFQKDYQFSNIQAPNSSIIQVQTHSSYIILLINQGEIINGSYYSNFSNIQIFSFLFEITFLSSPPVLTVEGDYITGISLTGQTILFITTYYQGVAILIIGQDDPKKLIYNPFGSGTLGISTYNIDYSTQYYYIAIWNSEDLIITISNTNANIIFPQQKLIKSNQVNINNFLQTYVYINSRFIVVTNNNGVSVYPNLLNDINEGKLLYYYPFNSIVSSFDYYNNILISVSDAGTYSYQFNNPVLISKPFQVNSEIQNFNITAYTNSYNQTQVQCQTLTLYYLVVSQPTSQSNIIYPTTNVNFNPFYYQQGQQYNIYYGSSQVININQILLGPALYITQPQIQPAISNDPTISFTNLLNIPKIQSQLKINSNLFENQEAIYSQLFYDPFIVNEQSQDLQDDYYQLTQFTSQIVLYKCSGLQNKPSIYIIEQTEIIVEQFALGLTIDMIHLAYIYNEVTHENKTFGHVCVYLLTQTSDGITEAHTDYNITKGEREKDVAVKQIAILQLTLYLLYSVQEAGMVLQTKLLAVDSGEIAHGIETLNDCIFFELGDLIIEKFTYNVPAYENILFLNTYSISNTGIQTYYLTLANYYLYSAEIIGSVIIPFTSQTDIKNIFYELTIDGIYCINNPQVIFYPRVEIIPYLFQSVQQKTPILPIQPTAIPTYNISSIKYAESTPRFLYLLAQQTNQYSYSIFIYRNTPSTINSLYYIITADDIVNERFSVVGAIRYDAIIYRSKGSNGYQSSIILPEYELIIDCNLHSNSHHQIEYNYFGFQANSLLFGPSSAQQEWISFQITNLISFVSQKNTITNQYQNGSELIFNLNGLSYLDPRNYFIGNIQTFQLNNISSDSGYYINLIPPVVSQPQLTIYKNPITAISTISSFTSLKTNLNQYWCTFVQTNHLVYITPYIYYDPQTSVKNQTVFIDYPLSYKLPILDPKPNTQNCPLIFEDQLSKGIVSVCGTKSSNYFLVSFTLYNPILKDIQDTQIINLNQAFNISNDGYNAIYNLYNANYLEIGIVVLQFRYNNNFGSLPPTDIIFSFIYAANLSKPLITNMQRQQSYQLIQPINAVYYIKNQDITNEFSITPFSISNEFLGDQPIKSMMFGLLCVSEIDEVCLSTENDQVPSSGAVITILFNQNFSLNNQIIIQPAINSSNDIYSNISQVNFYVSIISAISDYTSNSIQQIIQAGPPVIDGFIYTIPFAVVSKGTGFIIKLSFYQANGQYISSQYSCTLIGLTNQNQILKISASGYQSNIQIVAVVSNPTTDNLNQVTLLNYGIINQQCKELTNTKSNQNIVTAIGSYTYQSLESTPILNLMFPQTENNIPRTLISNNSIIHLLDTSPTLIMNIYPNYNIYQGVSLSNLTGILSYKGIIAQVTAQPIKTYVNDKLLYGGSGSTEFVFNLSNPPNWSTGKWFHKISGQFIWGSIMFVIIIGVLGFLFYKSQQQNYY